MAASKTWVSVCLLVVGLLPATASAVVLQPGPSDGKDIWTTSIYSFAPGGDYPGGGSNNESLVVGGFGDQYYSLMQFDLTGMPLYADSAVLYMFENGTQYTKWPNSPTSMYLDRITEAWDWTTSGTGRDRERLWWADRPSTAQWNPQVLPAPVYNSWYSVDITSLYNAWQSGTVPNYGLQFRPTDISNKFNTFYSSDYLDEPSLRPKLVVIPEPTMVMLTLAGVLATRRKRKQAPPPL